MKKELKLFIIFMVFFMLIGCEKATTIDTTTTTDIIYTTDTTNSIDITTNENTNNTTYTETTNNITYTETTDDAEEQFTVSFETFGGTIIQNQVITEGEMIVYPDNPTKEGYIFVGWHTTSTLNSPFSATDVIYENLTLYAEWIEVSVDDVVITFVSEYGNPIASIVAKPGEAIIAPSNPTDVFYNFAGWVIQGTTDVFIFNVMPDENIVLEAIWEKNSTYEITFFLNDENDEYDSFLFTAGEILEMPNDPQIEGYVFLGWYLSNMFVNEFDYASTMPANNMQIFAKLVPIEEYFYLITFESNGGTIIDSQVQVVGTKIQQPTEPAKKGYIFNGWYIDEDCTSLYNFENSLSEDITLYAGWTFDDSFTITYLVVSEEETRTIILAEGESYYLPRLFKDGYIFDWWYTSSTYQVRYREYLYFPVAADGPITLYAKWIEAPNAVTIEFDSNGGSDASWAALNSWDRFTGNLVANPGDEYTLSAPQRDGYTFRGWYIDPEFTTLVEVTGYVSTSIIFIIPNQDATYYAKWVSDVTGEVDDGSGNTGDIDLELIERLEEFGFICEGTVCTLEEYTNYNYIFDLETNTLSYIVDVSQDTPEGYREFDKVISIDSEYDVEYEYSMVENYGYEIHTELKLEGNYLTESYTIINFDSNVTSQENSYEKAIDAIEYLATIYLWIME